jgi:hypothetical protein
MALEQWEIDLRKHLEGIKPKKDWEEEIIEEIQSIPKNVKKNHTKIMLVLLLILGIAIFLIFSLKYKSSCSSDVCQPTPPERNSSSSEIAALRAEMQKMSAENKAEMQKLAGKMQWNQDRVTLIGMMMNENFMIIRNDYNKAHLIFFNRDWTIDQMPHYLKLSDEDRDYLQKYVKPAQ